MIKDKDSIKANIEKFKETHGGDYTEYYIGITNNIERRLTEEQEKIIDEHLNKGEFTAGSPFYSEECQSREVAVDIEQDFQNKGMLKLNKRSVGTIDSKFIYCYKVDESNVEVILGNSKDGKKMLMFIQRFEEYKKEV